MKKLLLITVLLLLSASLFCESIKKINLKEYELNSKIEKIFSLGEKINVYILGWSKDGKMAYIIDREIEGRGSCDINFIILDLVEDEKCFSKTISYGGNGEETFEQCLNNNARIFDKALKDFNIILKPVEFGEIPLIYGDDVFTFTADLTDIKEDIFVPLCSYKFVAHKNSTLTKVLNSKTCYCNSMVPTGYLKSPYEDRIAVIYFYSVYGFEGSYDIFCDFYGCNLKIGFSKN